MNWPEVSWCPDLGALVAGVLARSSGKASHLHGVEHWKRVAAAGHALLEGEPEADHVVVFLFALFHDSMRLNDGYDLDHGRRGFALARDLHGSLHTISDDRMDLLETVCDLHEEGRVTCWPTTGVCWDADRLNLWRVGVRPDPGLLSTPEAKRQGRILWGRDLQHKSFFWEDLAERFFAEGCSEPVGGVA